MKIQPRKHVVPIEKEKPKLKLVSAKREKFKQLIVPRMELALARIRIVGQCFSHNYEWEESEAIKIIKTLREAIDSIELRANKKSKDARDRFRL